MASQMATKPRLVANRYVSAAVILIIAPAQAGTFE
jgi:hypothetical protein